MMTPTGQSPSEAIERIGCQHLAHRGFNTLSGGEKQRVLIAQALAQGADHLILDEPTNHLDIRYQVEILELVAGLGITVLAAIHDISLAALFCDTVHLIADGQLITGGPPKKSSPPPPCAPPTAPMFWSSPIPRPAPRT